VPLSSWPSEEIVFHLLDNLHTTAAGPDKLPSWFLKLAAPSICSPVSHLYRLSITSSIVPSQWLISTFIPLPKPASPQLSCSNYRPISLTPILSRILEKLLVRHYIYPYLSYPDPSVNFSLQDQYALKLTGSTTAALTGLHKVVSDMLETSSFLHLIAFDFSKAFDTV